MEELQLRCRVIHVRYLNKAISDKPIREIFGAAFNGQSPADYDLVGKSAGSTRLVGGRRPRP